MHRETTWHADTVRAAGLQNRHIARILEVSRATVSHWLGGKRAPHALLARKVDLFMGAITAAMEDGELPVPKSIPADERSVKTVATVRRYMRELDG